jgi:hypothetical protein
MYLINIWRNLQSTCTYIQTHNCVHWQYSRSSSTDKWYMYDTQAWSIDSALDAHRGAGPILSFSTLKRYLLTVLSRICVRHMYVVVKYYIPTYPRASHDHPQAHERLPIQTIIMPPNKTTLGICSWIPHVRTSHPLSNQKSLDSFTGYGQHGVWSNSNIRWSDTWYAGCRSNTSLVSIQNLGIDHTPVKESI